MLNVACFVQSRLTDADFVIFSNYCLIGTRRKPSVFFSFDSVLEERIENGVRPCRRHREELRILHRRVARGAVRNGAHHGKRRAVDIGDLRHGSALHLAGNRREGVGDKALVRRVGEETVARGDGAAARPCADLFGGGAEARDRVPVRLKINLVDAGDQPHGVAEGAGVHIVLHKRGRHRDVADGQRGRERAADAAVEHERRGIAQDHRLCADGGKDLADAADRHHDLLAV